MQAIERYSKGAVALHWLIALLLAGEIALGFAMPRGADGFAEYQLHKSIGITILALSLLRLGWRFTHRRPAPLEGGVTGFLASAVHVGFYAFMILMPLTGWALVSSDRIDVPTLLFGVVPWPHLPIGEAWNEVAEEAHELLAWGGLALFALHVVGALRHHVMLGDGLLARMTFDGKAGRALAAGGAVIAVGLVTLFTVGGDREPSPAERIDEPSPVETVEPMLDSETEVTEQAEEVVEELVPEDTVEAEQAAEPEEVAAEPAGPPPSWTIQPGGTLRFTVDNAGNALNGRFTSWSGDIVMDPDAPESAEITIRVNLTSASMGDATQDNMLGGADFFNTASFAQATWRSTAVERVSGSRYRANGTLSLKGASRPQAITFTLSGNGNRRSVEGSASIDRTAFGVGTGANAENLAGAVRVNFAFEATS